MSSIRRLPSGIASPAARSIADYEVTSPIRNEPPPPVPPVRRGFSDVSDFQPEGAEGVDARLDTEAPLVDSPEDLDGPAVPAALRENAQLRTLAGVSEFEPSRPRYAQVLGSSLPPAAMPQPASSFRAPFLPPSPPKDAGAMDPTDILSPEAAAWELQNLDTSTPTVHEPEDLLFMLDPPGSAGEADPVFEMGLDDIIDEASDAVGALDAHATESFAAEGAMQDAFDAPPTDFLADVNDVNDVAPPVTAPAPEFVAEAAPQDAAPVEVAAPEGAAPEATVAEEPALPSVIVEDDTPREG